MRHCGGSVIIALPDNLLIRICHVGGRCMDIAGISAAQLTSIGISDSSDNCSRTGDIEYAEGFL